MSFFVTGTDTGVGKTHVVTSLLESYRAAGYRAAGMKPICCGDRDDANKLLAAGCDGLTVEDINPIWLTTPAAPLVAARAEGYEFELQTVLDGFRRLQERAGTILVEGVGGWLVPVAPHLKISDLARALELPVLLVVKNRLGCLNHTLLTVESIKAAGLECRAILLNEFDAPRDVAISTNREVLEEVCRLPVIAEWGGKSGFSDALKAVLKV